MSQRIVTQPSATITGVPPFIFAAPSGWVIDQAPNALCVLRPPEPVDGFWVNALLNHDVVARSVDFDAAAKITWARLQRSAKHLTETGERLVRFGGLAVYVRGAEMDGPEGGRLAQLHALWFGPTTGPGKTVDFFQLVLTAPVDAMEPHSKAILEMLSTFRFV